MVCEAQLSGLRPSTSWPTEGSLGFTWMPNDHNPTDIPKQTFQKIRESLVVFYQPILEKYELVKL